ncbi:MAG: hypothetical protein ACLR2G_01700 [Phascolarctobacterium faecium]
MYKTSGAVSETVKAAARAELGLDRPLLVLSGLAAGCLQRRYGTFVYSGTPVTALFVAKLQPTLLFDGTGPAAYSLHFCAAGYRGSAEA